LGSRNNLKRHRNRSFLKEKKYWKGKRAITSMMKVDLGIKSWGILDVFLRYFANCLKRHESFLVNLFSDKA